MRKPHNRFSSSPNAERLASFREQMADFARGERLRQLRQAKHLSQEDAAHEVGVSVRAYREWEKGGGIKWENAKSVGKFFTVDPEELVEREAADPAATLDDIPDLTEQLAAIRRDLAQIKSALGIDETTAQPGDETLAEAVEAIEEVAPAAAPASGEEHPRTGTEPT